MAGRGAREGANIAAAFTTRPFNVVANTASILGLLVAVLGEFALESRVIPLAYLCGLSLFLMVRYVRQERLARYGEGAQVMERAHRRLKEATDRYLFGSGSRESFFDGVQESLSAFAEAFTLVTGSNCRASLKEVFVADTLPPSTRRGGTSEPREELMIATIVRSDIDESRKVSDESADLLRDNSDFEQVLDTREPFVAGDLAAMWRDRKYRNSHWGEQMQAERDFPYQSTIVWPIEVAPPLGGQPKSGEERVIAFLCVDSRRRHAFWRRADVPFGGTYAHSLYPGLSYALVPSGGDRA